MVMLDGCYRSYYVEKLKENDDKKWAAKPRHMRYAFQIDAMSNSPAQEIKRSKVAFTSTAIMRSEATFTDTMQGLMSW